MKSKSLEKNILWLNFITILVISIGVVTSLYLIKLDKESLLKDQIANRVRVINSDVMMLSKEILKNKTSEIEEAVRKDLLKNRENIKIINLKGEVIFSSNEDYSNINIESGLQTDAFFQKDNMGMTRVTFPLVIDNEQKGNVIITLPYEIALDENYFKKDIYPYIPIIFSALIAILVFIKMRFLIKKEIIHPLKNLNEVCERIIKGDFSKKISHHGFNEMSIFSGNFEFMRDELKNSIEKQRILEKSRKELIACISHDLRTPLSSIKAYVEGIKYGICKNEEMLQKYIDIVYRKTESLNNLIDDLFIHSQVEAEELSINKKEVYSKDLFEKILYPLKEQFNKENKNLIIKESIPQLLINVDEIRIEQVVLNLLENSKKYSGEGENIYFRIFKKNNFLVIEVEDEGVGIEPSDLPYIFDKFYRGEKSRSSSKGGAGLGLSICKYIVEKHGGRIYASSTIGQGSKFSFELRINE